MFTIEKDSEAGRALAAMLDDLMDNPDVHKISIDDRTASPTNPGIALKVNERMWTPTLPVVA